MAQIPRYVFKPSFFFIKPMQNSFVQLLGIRIQAVSVDIHKDMANRKGCPFVTISKRMVDEQAFHERGGFFGDVGIIPALRPKQHRYNGTGVAHASGAAVCLDNFGVTSQNFIQVG